MANYTKWMKLYIHNITTPLPPLLLLTILCTLSYLLGSFLNSSQPSITTPCNPSTTTTNLDFTFHHSTSLTPHPTTSTFPSCPSSLYEYTPCEDRNRSIKFPRDRLIYRQRHCPSTNELLKCLVPAPFGYRNPFRWPVSRGLAWFANVPHQELVVEKAVQNWVRVEGDRFRFPGGGTMFPKGADAYIDDIARMIPIGDGSVRTAVDTGCGVASFGAYLMSRNVTTMSFAPRDSHEAQVQFALERGVPAMIGVIASIRLPYPSRAFDMAHCSRCLIPWHLYDGQYLAEVDRILRPGGYWVLSGPPINWQKHWKGWERTREDLDGEQKAIEAVATKLCWKKLKQQGDIAIWQKPTNHRDCQGQTLPFCSSGNADQAWYTELKTCLTPIPSNAGEKLKKWPERLLAVPLRIDSGSITGVTAETFSKDSQLWKNRVAYYKSKIGQLGRKGRYRNLLDMNAGLGGFAAAVVDDPVWVMNVMPTVAVDTLGVVYERGLIGTYQDWCEAMSTYPRTYDLIHADSVFSLYKDRCNMENILLEMDRILRPEGAVIFRDDVDVLVRVKSIADGMRWDSQFVDHEDGPLKREKILMAVKKYWTLPKSTPL